MDKNSAIAMSVVTTIALLLFLMIAVNYHPKTPHFEATVTQEMIKQSQEAMAQKMVAKQGGGAEKKGAAKASEGLKLDPSAVAKSEVSDVILMENKAYAHKKGIASFTHKKHTVDYKIACGECHHDDKGKPRDIKMGDKVFNCIACHSNPGKVSGKASKLEKLGYHADAIHVNCIGCHKAYDKENNTKAAPTSCAGCHPKK